MSIVMSEHNRRGSLSAARLRESDLDAAKYRRDLPLITTEGPARIDTNQMLAAGAITGPHRRTRPIIVKLRDAELIERIRGALVAIILGVAMAGALVYWLTCEVC